MNTLEAYYFLERRIVNIKDNIKGRLDELEASLILGKHLVSGDDVSQLISSISKFASILSSTDRDFLNAAKLAVAEKKVWC
jgi:hypothetical protein